MQSPMGTTIAGFTATTALLLILWGVWLPSARRQDKNYQAYLAATIVITGFIGLGDILYALVYFWPH